MHRKILLPALLIAVLFNFSPLFAASLSLTKIGVLDTAGKKYTEWWYTETKPVLQGTAANSTKVTITVDTKAEEVTSDATGVWKWWMNKDKGDYSVSIKSGSETYAFKMHLGQPLPTTVTGQTTSSVPETGFNQILGLTLGSGVVLLGSYLYMMGDNRRKVFLNRVLKE